MADTTVYLTIGEEESGKTALLRLLFQDICEVQETMSGDICEYRWGEQEFTTPVSDGYQKRFLSCENMRGLSIIDTKGINRIAKNVFEQIHKSAEKCSAILVIFDANHVNGSKLWDFIENFSSKKMIFFLTKCDMLSSEDLAGNLEKVKSYIKEIGISAPVFPVCTKENVTGTVPIEEVRFFIREQLVGQNPILNRQRENVQESKKILVELNKSFSLRKQQYLADVEILQKINTTMDAYVADHKQIIADLTGKLALEISKDIDSYQQEIISKMDPYKIKERFRTQQDFTDYLNMVNDNYKTMMTDSVNRKTMEALKGCLHDLEIVFREAVGYFNTRENLSCRQIMTDCLTFSSYNGDSSLRRDKNGQI